MHKQNTLTEKQYLKAVRKRLLKKSKRWGALLYRFNLRMIEIEASFFVDKDLPSYTVRELAGGIVAAKEGSEFWGYTSIEDLQRFHKKGFLRDTKGVEAFLKSNKRIELPSYV